jgi:pimeloyl-ACP methyl ester carboxylesterase
VLTPTQTGLGERAHLVAQASLEVFVQDVVGVLEAEELDDVVLVGHSFGGIAVTGVVDRLPERVRHLVYLDALLVEDGRTPFDTMAAEVVAARRAGTFIHSGVECLGMAPASAFGVTDAEDAAWVERRLTPHPIALYDEREHWAHPLANGRPCTYLACADPWYPALASSHDLARAHPDWTWRELPTGHDAMVLAPDLLTEVLWEIANQ